MVSHAEVSDRSRRAASVSSRTTRSKHHHRGASHHGGSNYVPQNEFPFFAQTGDVEIVISAEGHEKRYLLHRLILAQCSGFFEAGTSQEWSGVQNDRHQTSRPDQALTRIGEEEGTISGPAPFVTPEQVSRVTPGRQRWRYELSWDNVEDDEEPILVRKSPGDRGLFASTFAPPAPPPTRPKPATSSTGFFRSMANLTLGAQSTANLQAALPPVEPALTVPIIRDYDNLFRIFYNYAPTLNATNIASAYSECKALLALADMYDALPVVGSRVDHHLLRFSSRLFKQIAKYPPSYLKLGYLARSRIIFSEALTHVVGQWPHPYPYLKETGYEVPDHVIELIEDKFEDLEELKAKVEAKLFRLTLTTSRGERVNPGNDYLGWLAMSLFRQWLAENTTPPPVPILKNTPPQSRAAATTAATHNRNASTDSTSQNPARGPLPPLPVNNGRVYRLIGSPNPQAFLPHDDLKRFLKIHPSDTSGVYTRENLKRFEKKMDEVKNIARDIVKPLTRNCLEVDMRAEAGGGLPYLTCTKVEEGDLPWD